MHRLFRIILIFIITCSLCIYVYAQDLTELQEKSNQINQALTESNNRLQVVQDNISANMQELQELDNNIAQSQEELNTINTNINDLVKQINENQEKLAKVQEQYDNIQELLDKRLISMYETPKFQFLQVILESKNATEFLSRYYAMKELAEYDKQLKVLYDLRKEQEKIYQRQQELDLKIKEQQ